MNAPELLATLTYEQLAENDNLAQETLAELRACGKLPEPGDVGDGPFPTWVDLTTEGQRVMQLWRGEPPPHVGDIIQFRPEHHWAGSLAVVDEVRQFGGRAYVQVPKGGKAFIRWAWSEAERTGGRVEVSE